MIKKLMAGFSAILLATLLIACAQPRARAIAQAQQASSTSSFFSMADAQADGFAYAYAPSITLKDGMYHVFFCSKGWLQYSSWDAIRYTTSSDGRTWSKPKVMLQATGANGMDMAACDPSLVRYQGFYYLYYSSAVSTAPGLYQTVIQVARSQNIDGPYLTYTQRGSWENTPGDPKVLIYPIATHSSSPTGYGAGQQSVVVVNGELWMWYTDDSVFVNGKSQVKTYLLHSSDPLVWTPDQSRATNLVNEASIDVKYDAWKFQFVMIRVENEFSANSYLARAYSIDGLNWTQPEAVYASSAFPPYTHDAGMAGDETGNLTTAPTLFGFGAPYDLSNANTWAKWDLYGGYIDPVTAKSKH
jgi:hypothetical protein